MLHPFPELIIVSNAWNLLFTTTGILYLSWCIGVLSASIFKAIAIQYSSFKLRAVLYLVKKDEKLSDSLVKNINTVFPRRTP